MYGVPLISIGVIPASGNVSPLDAEWITVREGTPIEQSYTWYVSSGLDSGEYVLIIILDYSGMMGTYHQEIMYSDPFFVINDGIDPVAPPV